MRRLWQLRLRQPARERGQELVEFALVMPLILLLALASIQAGQLWSQVTEAGSVGDQIAIAAARFGGNTPELADVANEAVKNSWLDPQALKWSLKTQDINGNTKCSKGACHCQYGDVVVITIDYTYKFDFLIHWSGVYHATRPAVCWRGITPGGINS